MQKDSIAFVSTYDHPTRDSLEAEIRRVFPEFHVDNISVMDLVKRNKRWIAPNLYFCVTEYGRRLRRRSLTLRDSYFQTTYLFKKIREKMPSVIDPDRHAFSLQTQSMYDCGAPGVPHFIYTDHTHLSNTAYQDFDRDRLRPEAWIRLERSLYHNATCVFTRSSDVTKDLIEMYGMPSARVECVYAGSNVKVDHGLPPRNDDYRNHNILFVGGDWERKGGPQLVEAFRNVLPRFPDARLTIIGANPDLTDVPNCRVLGRIPLTDIPAHYAEASIFCLPTRLEPFGIAFVEAMLHRLPIIGTRVGAVPDLIQQDVTGILVRPDETSELIDALATLLGDAEKCRRYGDAGFQRAATTYTWEAVGRRIRTRVLKDLDRRDDSLTIRAVVTGTD